MCVTVVDQEAGELFTGSGTVLHAGRTTSRDSRHEAMNYFPVRWLLDGLPHCIGMLRSFCDFVPAYAALQADCAAPFHALTAAVPFASLAFAGSLLHSGWAVPFFHFLLEDVAAACEGRSHRVRYLAPPPRDSPRLASPAHAAAGPHAAHQADDPRYVTRQQLAQAREQLVDMLALLHTREARAFTAACRPHEQHEPWPTEGDCTRVACPPAQR